MPKNIIMLDDFISSLNEHKDTSIYLTPTERETFSAAAERLSIDPSIFFDGSLYSTEPYTSENKKIIISTLCAILKQEMNKNISSGTYTGTAGAPLAGKSTYLEAQDEINTAIFADPDRNALAQLKQEFNLTGITQNELQESYQFLRDATNAIANFMILFAIAKNKSICHGTTGTSPRMVKIYQELLTFGYKVNISVILPSDEDARVAAAEYRAKVDQVIQVSSADISGKERLLLGRLQDWQTLCNTGRFKISCIVNTATIQDFTAMKKFTKDFEKLTLTKILKMYGNDSIKAIHAAQLYSLFIGGRLTATEVKKSVRNFIDNFINNNPIKQMITLYFSLKSIIITRNTQITTVTSRKNDALTSSGLSHLRSAIMAELNNTSGLKITKDSDLIKKC